MKPAGAEAPPGAAGGVAVRPVVGCPAEVPGAAPPPGALPSVQPVAAARRRAATATAAGLVREVIYGTPLNSCYEHLF